MSHKKNIVVYCGSRRGEDPAYAAFAGRLGEAIGKGGYCLVYGGGGIGLMGITADAALACGAEVTGIMPRSLIAREQAHLGLSRLIPTDCMSDRKNALIRRGDAFVILPGGIGTMEELFDTLSYIHLSDDPLHQSPVIIADIAHIYAPLQTLWDNMVTAGFIPARESGLLHICHTLEEITALWPPPSTF